MALPALQPVSLQAQWPTRMVVRQSRLLMCKGRPQRLRRRLSCRAAAADASGPDHHSPSTSAPAPLRRTLRFMSEFAQAQFLPLALLSALALGCTFPDAGMAAVRLNVPSLSTTGIFIVQGLSLRRGEAMKALQSGGAVAYGMLSILLLTPLMALAALRAPLTPPELAVGLAVFCCMPTALSSGVTFTQQIGGNVALALLLTVGSNMLGIFTIPFLMPALLGSAGLGVGSVALQPLPLLVQLIKTILVPTLIGASIRGLVPGMPQRIDARKRQLSYLAALLLAIVPWMQVSSAVSQRVPLDAAGVAAVAVLGLGVHLVFLALNTLACRLLRLGGPDPAAAQALRRALILTASVKTLPVAVTVLGKMGPVLGDCVGVAVISCVLAHLGQILVDSAMVSRWKQQDKALASAAA